MNKEELAVLLNGTEKGKIKKEHIELAQQSGLVIMFGESDDLVEFKGVLYDEIEAYNGACFTIVQPNTFLPCQEDDGKYWLTDEMIPVKVDPESSNQFKKFNAIWCPPRLNCSWVITTDVPHATFDLMEDGELFSRGIVVDIYDL